MQPLRLPREAASAVDTLQFTRTETAGYTFREERPMPVDPRGVQAGRRVQAHSPTDFKPQVGRPQCPPGKGWYSKPTWERVAGDELLRHAHEPAQRTHLILQSAHGVHKKKSKGPQQAHNGEDQVVQSSAHNSNG